MRSEKLDRPVMSWNTGIPTVWKDALKVVRSGGKHLDDPAVAMIPSPLFGLGPAKGTED